jgi:predicted ATPase
VVQVGESGLSSSNQTHGSAEQLQLHDHGEGVVPETCSYSSSERPMSTSGGISELDTVVFALLGDYWTFVYRRRSFSLKDSKGLRYIQRLLQNPDQEFHSLDLAGGSEIPPDIENSSSDPSDSLSIGRPGDAGEMLDSRAKEDYRRRLRELRQDLDEQRDRGDVERAARTESEIDFLAREIARAVGLGGRDRRAASIAERARLNVQRTIRSSIEKIAVFESSLGEYLNRTIKTGNFCSHIPDPAAPLKWQFSIEHSDGENTPTDTGPLLPARQTAFIEPDSGRTPFIGREQERSVLRLYLGRALRGERKVVMLSGAPGVGKSRLANEIRLEGARNGFVTLGGSCYEQEAAVPFGPFIQILDAALSRLNDNAFVRNALGADAIYLTLLLPHLRRRFTDIPSLTEKTSEPSRITLFNGIVNILASLVGDKPLLLLLDDLQWSDEASLALLAHFVRSQPRTPVLIIGTYRDIEWTAAGPLAALLDELMRIQALETIVLGGLPELAVGEMIRVLSGQNPPEQVTSLIYSGTEGNPFFVEELFRHLVESGQLTAANGQFLGHLTLETLNVPRNLRLIIGRRLARLGQTTREILGSAAVIGRSFSFGLLEATCGIDADSLITLLEDAEHAGLLTSTIEYPEPRFHFSHELIRKSVLESLSPARLQRLHVKVANAIEVTRADDRDDKLNNVAFHLWHAGIAADPSRTLLALSSAAQRALAQSAYDVAIDNSGKALERLKCIGDVPARDELELSLQVVLGGALMATEGYAAPQVAEAFARARSLCQQVVLSPHLAPVLFGLFMFYVVRGDHQTAHSLAEQLLGLAEEEQAPMLMIDAHVLLGGAFFYRGHFQTALQHLEHALLVIGDDTQRSDRPLLGQDRLVLACSWIALTLCALGYPDQAVERSEQAIRLANTLAHPFSQAFALTFGAVLHQLRGEWQRTAQRAQEALAISNTHKFSLFVACDTLLLAWAQQDTEQTTQRSENFQNGLARFRMSGARLTVPYYLALMAEAHGQAGRMDDGFRTIADAEAVMQATGEGFYAAEIHRLKGVLLLETKTLDASAAEQSLRLALETSRSQHAKLFELRASISLSEYSLGRGRPMDARELLSDIYPWFTEGLDTPDLIKAERLMAICNSMSNATGKLA